jgi:hypothetical protein
MKITVELTDAQVKGIKEYLKEVSGLLRPTKDDISEEINGIVQTYLQSPQSALTDYIKQSEAVG